MAAFIECEVSKVLRRSSAVKLSCIIKIDMNKASNFCGLKGSKA